MSSAVVKSERRLRSADKKSNIPSAPHTSEQDATLSWERVRALCGRRREPLVRVYLPPQSTQIQRDFALRSFIHFCVIEESRDELDIAAADAKVSEMTIIFYANYSAEQPFAQRVGGPRSLWKFVCYMQARKSDYWGADSETPMLFLEPLPGKGFYPIL